MSEGSAMEVVGAELRTLREEVHSLRTEQRELARSVEQLTQTFRSLAAHLGIASEPYRPAPRGDRSSDPSGFA
ncbi:MAG: hypothetical protein ACREDK_01710 [Thermoplasmata archaeon]